MASTAKSADTISRDTYLDEQKLVFEYIKHVTTLDTGSIVLLTVLLEKFFHKPVWGALISVSFAGFVLSLVCLTLAAFGVIRSIRTPQAVSIELVRFTAWTFVLGLLGFLGGISSLALFAAKNWS